ncbi:hypothetical protein PFICI_04929 [Pestalotiopsis fici W106-1]|uniref:Uncharacterized protein n=1 Tax=Pestalotiopsis fici (strain W106-1 / CGMCC3.15140) TaxID=1229662 RepID=W3XAC3_PESFW|nr:uncharacterized protein PFICI_04929 [Pestalotiopsis fici W106-1]ETS83053.1 hypothetical protein PFICI_04929 [Pestalotiopsis fici W106-1]
MQRINKSFNALLDACARTDVIEPVTGKTIFETAVDMCDDAANPDSECLRYLLTQGSPSNLVSSHVYDVLDSRIVRMKEHLNGCIKIMQHGWISEKARSLVFDWMISYLPSRSVNKDGSAYSPSKTKSDEKAAKFFPWFLNRRQLDDLWDQGLAFYRRHRSVPSQQRWMTIPWLHINAERGDIEAITLLLSRSFPSLRPARNTYLGDDEGPTPLMRAISAGHRDLARLLIKYCVFWPRDRKIHCCHNGSSSTGTFTCNICPYGQRSAFELAFQRGDVELVEEILRAVPCPVFSRIEKCEMPRVLSHGNAMAEWARIRLPLEWFSETDTIIELYRKGTLPHETLKRVDQKMKNLTKLRVEISEIRNACIARARSIERERVG